MNGEKKELLFVDISQIKDIRDDYLMAEYNGSDSVFKVIHRYNGMSEEFLRTSLHWHNYYELEYVYGGSGTHILSKSCCKMERGYACLRTPHNLHSTLQDASSPLKLYNIKFSEDFIPENIATYILTSDKSLWVMYSDTELETAVSLIERLFRELSCQDRYSLTVIKSIFADLFVSFIRKHHFEEERAPKGNQHVAEAIRYIHNNFRDNITLKNLSEKVYLTPNYLGELFIAETGKTCAEYIEELRFTLAVQLLLNTVLSVKEITDECGFHSTSYFIRRFRLKYGIPPLRYRNGKSRGVNQI